MVKYTIVNLVASANLNATLDLYNLAITIPNIEYEPEQFPGAILRIHEPKLTLLLFKNGKLICAGAKKEEFLKKGLRKAGTLIRSVNKEAKKAKPEKPKTPKKQKEKQGNSFGITRIILQDDDNKQLVNFKVGIEIRVGNINYITTLEESQPYRFGYRGFGTNENFQFIGTRNIDREINGKLWDKITLTENENYVIEALKIIEPNTERIAFIEENPRERTAVIKLSNATNVLPLLSMGDGINRILTIILALVNSNNGILLIDEFENGLHYTVQERLWSMIFNLAKKLNVQVFVTTHSEDCISGFENILNNSENTSDGKLIRLDNENGIIKQVEFNAKELKIANEQNIDIR